MTPEMATNLLAYDTYTQTSGSPMARLCKANQEAVKTLRKHGDQAVCPCFRRRQLGSAASGHWVLRCKRRPLDIEVGVSMLKCFLSMRGT